MTLLDAEQGVILLDEPSQQRNVLVSSGMAPVPKTENHPSERNEFFQTLPEIPHLPG